MKTIGAFDAKTRLSHFLELVERGESFVITKRGRPVASLAPIENLQKPGPKELVQDFRRQLPRSFKKFTVKEIIEFKNHGRR